MEFAANLFYANPESTLKKQIIARLVYRDEHGSVIKEEYADIGYCSGLKPQINIEMNSIRNKMYE